MKKKRILVAPLDWGLGHATRCVPIINELLRRNADVIIAADHRPFELLKKEFPALEHVRFPGYSVQYDTKGNLLQSILRQLPAIIRGFQTEHRYLEKIINKYRIDAVISDSRFGAYSPDVYSVFLIHQLHIVLPPSFRWFEHMLQYVIRKQCNKFNEVWIPDVAGALNLAGILSHPPILPKNSFYIGPLTRLKKIEVAKSVDILVILSGPEPQRTVFEEILLRQLTQTSYRTVIVRGKTEHNTTIKVTPTLSMINSLDSNELSHLIASSKIIVSRPGYSTIMDLSFHGAKAIFVPTPQQTEQEYLAKELMIKNIAYSETQDTFNLERALHKSVDYTGFVPTDYDLTILQQRIDNLLHTIEKS